MIISVNGTFFEWVLLSEGRRDSDKQSMVVGLESRGGERKGTKQDIR